MAVRAGINTLIFIVGERAIRELTYRRTWFYSTPMLGRVATRPYKINKLFFVGKTRELS